MTEPHRKFSQCTKTPCFYINYTKKRYHKNTAANEWISLNLQHQFLVRGDLFKMTKTNKLRVGNNQMVNRMSALNEKKTLAWLNLSFVSFKLKSKGLFLGW